MLSKIGMPLVYIFFAVMIVKPLYGIAFFLCFEGMLNPQHYVPGYIEIHMGSIFLCCLSIVVLLHRRDMPNRALGSALIFFVCIALLSRLFNDFSQNNKQYLEIVRIAKCITLGMILFAYVRTKKEFLFISAAMAITLHLNIVFQIMQCWFGSPTPVSEESLWAPTRYSGFFYDSNSSCFYLVFALPFVYYCFQHAKKKSTQIICVCSLGLCALGVFLSISRSAFLGLMLFGGMIFFKDLKKISTSIIIILVFVCIAGLAGSKWNRDTTDASSSVRLIFWSDALKLFASSPFYGVGPGNTKQATREKLHKNNPGFTHNTPLSLLAEMGLAGFIPFICIPIIAWRSLRRLIRSKTPFYSEYAAYYQAGLLGFLFCTMFFSMQYLPMAWAALFFPIILEKIYTLEQRSTQ